MPPGIYVPRQSPAEHQAQNTPAYSSAEAGKADLNSEPVGGPVAEPKAKEEAAAPQAAPDSGHGDKLYVVVKNDSLWLIARKNGLTIEELASYNSLPANAKLKVGQKLYIPAAGTKAVKGESARKDKSRKKGKAPAKRKKSGAKSASAAKAKLPPDGIYTIKAGDNFSVIAKRYGLKVSSILAANPGVDSSRLKIGQKIRLTADAATVPAKKTAAKKPAVEQPAAPAGEAKSAPAAEQKASASADGEDLLKNVEDIKTDKPGEASAASDEAVNAVVSDKSDPTRTVPDKDQVLSDADGRTTIVVGENTTLDSFCKKYRISQDEVKKRNPEIASSGKIKAGAKIRLIGTED